MRKLIAALLFLVLGTLLAAQTVDSYNIDVEFFPQDASMYNNPVSSENFMRGNVSVKFSDFGEGSLNFYLHGELRVDSIMYDDRKVDFDQTKSFFYYDYSLTASIVTLNASELDPKNELVIYYSGFMNSSRARSLSDYMRIDKNEGVFLRSYGYSLWFPIYLKGEGDRYKADFSKIQVTFPANYKCVVAGKLIDESVENDKYTSVWQPGVMEISDIQCTAREYKLIYDDNVFVYYMNNKEVSENILDYVLRLKKVYAENLRSIDENNSLYVMEMPKYGDISSSNVVGISEANFNSFQDDIHSKLTIAHELVHPYLKIPVTKENPFYAFVIEGFPSFFQVYGMTKVDENYNLKEKMKKVEESYLKKKKTGRTMRGRTVPNEKPILKITADEIGTYKDKFILNDRVWLFFYDLWGNMGDEKFDEFLRELFKSNKINYTLFENLVVKYLPGYKERLNIWLNTNEYPKEFLIR